jgi:2-oxoglutarate ferredoxin oxidoreductase subunit gamma
MEVNIRFCGFGGQGIILSGTTLGTAVVTYHNLYAVQTQSYGSEARGGMCQAELIISDAPIQSPHSDEKDILVALSPTALEEYLPSLKPGGTLIIDPLLIDDVPDVDARVIEVPAAETADELGNRLVANMVLLGFLIESTGMVGKEDLVQAVAELVPERYLDLNKQAVDRGIGLAEGTTVEV